MTTEIAERRQVLTFSEAWTAMKWDEAAEYVGAHQNCAPGIKGADVVAASTGPHGTILMIAEFKDPTHPSIPEQQREAKALEGVSDALIDALGRKTTDTLAGATFSHDLDGGRSPTLETWSAALQSGDAQLLVLFCVEVNRSQAAAAGPWTKKLQKRLRWLGPSAQVVVTTSFRPFDDIGIRYEVR